MKILPKVVVKVVAGVRKMFRELVRKNKELSKELKVKVMRIRMSYTKIKKAFDEDVKEFTEELVPEELKGLNQKENRSEEENARMEELTNKVNSEYQEFLIQKGNEEVKDVEDTLTMDEYSDIVEVNAGNDVEINGNKIEMRRNATIKYHIK